MTTRDAHSVLIGRTETGFRAASVGAPYFCFESETEEALESKVKAALAFYYANQIETVRHNAPARQRTLKAFTPFKEVPMKQYAAA